MASLPQQLLVVWHCHCLRSHIAVHYIWGCLVAACCLVWNLPIPLPVIGFAGHLLFRSAVAENLSPKVGYNSWCLDATRPCAPNNSEATFSHRKWGFGTVSNDRDSVYTTKIFLPSALQAQHSNNVNKLYLCRNISCPPALAVVWDRYSTATGSGTIFRNARRGRSGTWKIAAKCEI